MGLKRSGLRSHGDVNSRFTVDKWFLLKEIRFSGFFEWNVLWKWIKLVEIFPKFLATIYFIVGTYQEMISGFGLRNIKLRNPVQGFDTWDLQTPSCTRPEIFTHIKLWASWIVLWKYCWDSSEFEKTFEKKQSVSTHPCTKVFMISCQNAPVLFFFCFIDKGAEI